MKLKFSRTLQLGYGFSILVVMVVGAISYNTLNNLLLGNKAVEHSNLVMQKLAFAISTMKDAETGQRGYLLTNKEEFLEPYNGAGQKALEAINQAAALSAGNAQQQHNIAATKQILVKLLNTLQALIDKKQQGQAITENDFRSGKSAMDDLRKAVDKAENGEQKILDQRIALLDRYTMLAPVVIICAIVLAVLISVFSYLRVVSDVNEKDRLRHQLEIKEGETAAYNEDLTAANEEINAANEEISAANEELISINDELLQAQDELATVNQALEERVKRRTLALKESEAQTQALNEELTAMNEELAAANEEMLATNEELSESQQKLQRIINDLSLAKGEVEKSEKLFRSIATNIPKSVIIVIDKERRFVAMEGDLAEKIGYNTNNYKGKLLEEVVPPESYKTAKPLYDRALAGEQFRIERKNITGDDFQVDFVPLKDDEGKVYAALVIALDITDMKKAEERSAKLAAIVESSDDAIISKTPEGIITSWNRAAERMFGYTESEMIGQSILKLIPEDRHGEEPLIIGRIKNGERIEHFETKRITNNKKLLDVSLTASALRDAQGNITGISKIVRDVSEKKRDELRKNDFIGMVSHELKTPLTSLTALIQVLNQKLQKSEDAFIPNALGKASLQVKKMSSMINGFLNISRLESGKIMIEKQNFDLAVLIKEIRDEAELITSGHTLIFKPSASLMVVADRDKIGSVISNLISNAIKYSPKGKTITIECENTLDMAIVSVKDEGIGIKASDIEKLFERYYRVNADNMQHISGFGIGLYLSAEIIQRHEGRIWVQSEIGTGSTFYFSLPLNAA